MSSAELVRELCVFTAEPPSGGVAWRCVCFRRASPGNSPENLVLFNCKSRRPPTGKHHQESFVTCLIVVVLNSASARLGLSRPNSEFKVDKRRNGAFSPSNYETTTPLPSCRMGLARNTKRGINTRPGAGGCSRVASEAPAHARTRASQLGRCFAYSNHDSGAVGQSRLEPGAAH